MRNNGIPTDWHSVERWLDNSITPEYPQEAPMKEIKREFTEIPLLENYEEVPDESFWKNFPKRELPKKATTRINTRNFAKLVKKYKPEMTRAEGKRADRIVRDLQQGAEAYQKSKLPPMTAPNAKSAYQHGALITDKIASWIKEGFVAGPFDSPPAEGFRANPLIAIVRNGKVRPVLNMSGPRGQSFNDNVDKSKLEKVHMDTAGTFGQKLLEAGTGAVFSKFDYGNAYKTVPSKVKDYPLQGFVWLGKYFVETQQTFGGIPSVCNFDREGNTLKLMATLESKIPRDTALRILDDTSNIGREGREDAVRFKEAMERICGFVDMPLAPECPKREKAFTLEQRGVVMGIGFDSKDMSWFMPQEKADRAVRRCLDVVNSFQTDLKRLEKVMGSVNDAAQMMPFCKFYKGAGYQFLASFGENYNIMKLIPSEVKDELLVISKIIDTARHGAQ